ncbi:hypothetical protein [Dactylosporangium sp. NPDC049140]|uniref:hypothetical protein n=1 Tax=Dactylosporangium sp. NPDC049140 TaxID=3155647 RepID=UPI0033E2DE06
MHLSAQHCQLMPQHQQLDVLRATVPGELREHLQNLTQEQVHQRGCHGLDRRCCRWIDVAQNRTSQPPNREFEPHKFTVVVD